jgi:hypothetical protein
MVVVVVVVMMMMMIIRLQHVNYWSEEDFSGYGVT